MDRINQILHHSLFKTYMEANAVKEQERIFCKHNMSHVLDVARIAYILNMEEAYQVSKDMIYAAALLHDIGRHVQYETGEKHAFVSARLAPEILRDCGFEEDEIIKLKDKGAHIITLGKRILRTETAGFVAASLIQYELSDLGGVI